MVRLDDTGEPYAVLTCPVGSLYPPTAGAGEHLGMSAAAKYCTNLEEVHADYQNLVNINVVPKETSLSKRLVHAGLRRSILGGVAWSSSVKVSKVLAHQSLDAIPAGTKEWFAAKGNYEADLAARHAAQTSTYLPQVEEQDS